MISKILILIALLSVCSGDDPVDIKDGSDSADHHISDVDDANLHRIHTLDGIHIAKFDFELVHAPFVIALWIFAAGVAKICFHLAPKLSTVFPESCLLIVVGLIVGGFLALVGGSQMRLTPKTFFNFMLPPIILDAGYFMPNKLFFDNLGTILLMAVVGTLWNTFSIGLSLWGISHFFGFGGGRQVPLLQCLLFSSLISAVDPVAVLAVFEEIHVNELLYIVVFGESLLNDAVTVALYEMFEEYAILGPEKVTGTEILKGFGKFPVVAIGGTLIGVIAGLAIGLVTRFTSNSRVMEPLLIFVMAYIAYLTAEMFHLSGIMAATFCGMTMKNYVRANISQKSLTTLKYSMKMLSSGAETIIFVILGVSTVNDGHEWNTSFVLATITFCTVYRAMGTFGLSAFANYFRITKIGGVDQFVIAYGGLRGAIAVALVLLIDKNATLFDDGLRSMMVTTTIAVIYFTVFIQGMTIKPIVEFLDVKRSEKRKPTMNERLHEKAMEHIMAGMESIVGHMGKYNLRAKLRALDAKFLRPFLIRNQGTKDPKILETYAKLTMEDMKTVMVVGGQRLRHQESVMRAKKRLHMEDYEHPRKVETPEPESCVEALLAKGLQQKSAFRRCSYSRHEVRGDDKDDLLDQLGVNLNSNPTTKRRSRMDRKWQTVDIEEENTGPLLGPSPTRRCSAGDAHFSKNVPSPPRSAPPTSRQDFQHFNFNTSSSIPEESDEEIQMEESQIKRDDSSV